jgi:hypothetical protein
MIGDFDSIDLSMQKATMMELDSESESIALTPVAAPRKKQAIKNWKLVQKQVTKQAVVRRASKSRLTMIGGNLVDSIANLQKFDKKRGARFHYDPHQITTFMHHFSGTITSVVMCSPWVWFHVMLYIAWLTADIQVQDGGIHPPLDAVDNRVSLPCRAGSSHFSLWVNSVEPSDDMAT